MLTKSSIVIIINHLTNTTTMRQLTLAIVAGLALSLFSVSCGSKKVAVASYPEYTGIGNTGTRSTQEVKEENDECQEQAFNAPAGEFRAFASAVSEDPDFARQKAAAFARAELANQIETLTLNVMKGYRGDTKYNGKLSNEEDIKQDVGQMAEQTLKSSKIICSNKYRRNDGTYRCTVCVSVPSQQVEMVSGAVALSDDERLGVEFREQQFRNSYKDELEAFRKRQKEGK